MAEPDEPTAQHLPPPQARKDPLVGSTVANKYRVVEHVARGGMASIYRAVQEPLGRVVALKVLTRPNEMLEQDPKFQERFFLEAATLGRLNHPNIVTVYDYGFIETLDRYYIVMEFVEGRTLSKLLREKGRLEPTRAVRLALEITRALHAAHVQDVVHRDLKPSNIMLTESVGRGAAAGVGLRHRQGAPHRQHLQHDARRSHLGLPPLHGPRADPARTPSAPRSTSTRSA